MSYNLPYLKYKDTIVNSRAVLAPMAGVTDIPFRKMVRKWAKDCFVFTEMINATVFVQSKKPEMIANISEDDDPIIFQFCGGDPYYIAKAAEKAQKMGASGIDINMGCPTPKITKKGDGSGLLKDYKKTKEIFQEVVPSVDIPVSVKIRAGWDDSSIIAVEYSQLAEECGLSAVAIHGRTRQQFYQGKANWDYIKIAQESVNIPVLGSGDLFTPEDAKNMVEYTKCAGAWVARGCLGAPWIVAQIDDYIKNGKLSLNFTDYEKVGFMIEHLTLMVNYYGERRAVPEFRKHALWGIKNMPNNLEIRPQINTLTKFEEVRNTLLRYQESLIN